MDHSRTPRNMRRPVLCVDLDGTLVACDTLIEGLMRLLRRNPALVFLLPFWLLGGRARFKEEIAKRVTIDAGDWPYRPEVLEFLGAEHRDGRSIVLATGSDRRTAEGVAAHLGFFSEILASDGRTNLKGRTKATALVQRYGPRGYLYAGDGWVDLPVWSHSAGAVIVGATPGLEREVARLVPIVQRLGDDRPGLATLLLRLARPHQWVKNLLLLVPLVTGHRVTDLAALLASFEAIAAVCLASSAVYAFNDTVDLLGDRIHPTKRIRPLASGTLPGRTALWFSGALAGAALLIASDLPLLFLLLVVTYLVGATAYSLWLKRLAYLDVITLAGLYVLRVLLGAAAIGVPASGWLVAFTASLFLSLALLKRCVELERASRSGRDLACSRGYHTDHAPALRRLGGTSGILAVVILAFYVGSTEAALYYTEPLVLWGLIPVVGLWLERVWRIARSGGMHDDPVIFALKDARSYLTLAALGGLMLIAI